MIFVTHSEIGHIPTKQSGLKGSVGIGKEGRGCWRGSGCTVGASVCLSFLSKSPSVTLEHSRFCGVLFVCFRTF